VNVERFHAIVNALKGELEDGRIVPVLEQLATSLRQLVQEPNQPAHQQTVSSARAELDQALSKAPSNSFSPAWRQALDEVGVPDLLGERLRERIETIFERNEITPSAAADEIEPIAQTVKEFGAALDRLQLGLVFFGIGAEELAPGEFEIGFLIPRPEVHEELVELGREFVKLSQILGPFLELSTGTREPVRVRSIASSAFEAFLHSAPATALVLATALERLISSYEKVMNIRLARQQLKDAGASARTLESVEEDAASTMERDINVLADELLADTPDIEQGRANELRTELVRSLNALANRIDRGYTVEVRAGELPPPDDADEDPSEEDQQARSTVHEVLAKQERLKFANLTGQPILALPEGVEDGLSESPRSPND